MASLAHNLSMSTAEWKAGGSVVNFDIRAIASLGSDLADQHKSRSKQDESQG